MTDNQPQDLDRHWMLRAMKLARLSEPEDGRSNPSPRVGVVAIRDGELLGESYRGAKGPGTHAEFGLLEELEGEDLSDVTVYTTLEPCSSRNHPKIPCAVRMADVNVSAVFIGIYDPNPAIYRKGWRTLRDAGIALRDFPGDLRDQIRADNEEFLAQFTSARGVTGRAAFDYEQNGGRFSLSSDEHKEFITRWTMAGKGSIYALDNDHNVALARYAKDFAEIDDPGSLDFSDYSRNVREGEIVVFRHDGGYALVKVDRVLSGTDYGDEHTELQMTFELR